MLTKKELKSLPKALGDEGERQMQYVQAVLSGKPKENAFIEFFPEVYADVLERAEGNKDNVRNAMIKQAINRLENRNAVKKMYEVAHKNQWTNFVAKKHVLYENLFTMSVDENNSVRDRIASTKVLLDHMPKFEEDKTIVVEVKDEKAEFIKELRAMQIALYKEANKDAIDVEIEDSDGQ